MSGFSEIPGFEVLSVVESCSGSSDREVLDFARKRKAIFVTGDHDFGEWVFAHHEPSFDMKYQAITVSLMQVLKSTSSEDIEILAPFFWAFVNSSVIFPPGFQHMSPVYPFFPFKSSISISSGGRGW
ncbi:MAG: DUF5615 family PIN-like protein [Candidatus Atribacteria bacterium]|nr:DUF5615 family PIN-like protein [Candidatus Atribacteria bacterium]